MRRALSSPILHVLILGAIVAVAILLAKGPPTGDESRRVAITGSDLLQLRARFARTWQREPTAAELRGALEQHVRQEVLYREALARGYDRDDPVVRRAMQQKMEYLAASQALREPPTEKEIEAFFALRQERYRLPAVLSFSQVYVNPDRRGADTERHANELLQRLRRDGPGPRQLDSWGDPIMLGVSHAGQTEQDVSATFGEEFAATLLTLPVGGWSGPVRSGYGLHLAKLSRREESRIPDWREVRPRVVGDMEFEARNSAKDQLYQEIAQNYHVVFDRQVRDLLESVE